MVWGHFGAAVGLLSLASGELFTPKHEAGRCAIRGTCGSSGFFSPALPCPDNGLAKEPEDDMRTQLVEMCGSKWESGPVCCEKEQVQGTLLLNSAVTNFPSLMYCQRTSKKRRALSQNAQHARTTSTTSSAPSPVLLISLSSST